MRNALKGLVASKKVWVFIIGVVVVIINRTLDVGLTGEDLTVITGTNIATILGIAAADHGKEKAKIEADSAKERAATSPGATLPA